MDFNNLEHYWLDDTTFIMVFGYQNIDNDEEEYHIESEWHKEDNSYHFIKVYNYDTTHAEFTEEEKQIVINKMNELMIA